MKSPENSFTPTPRRRKPWKKKKKKRLASDEKVFKGAPARWAGKTPFWISGWRKAVYLLAVQQVSPFVACAHREIFLACGRMREEEETDVQSRKKVSVVEGREEREGGSSFRFLIGRAREPRN